MKLGTKFIEDFFKKKMYGTLQFFNINEDMKICAHLVIHTHTWQHASSTDSYKTQQLLLLHFSSKTLER